MAADESSSQGAVTLTIDGRKVVVPRGTNIWEAARQVDVDIPALCHDPGMRPVGVSWGFRDRAELEAHGASAVCADPAELSRWLLG